MIIVGVLLNIVGLGIFCWALFALATYALPFFIGMTVGIYSFQAEQVRSVPPSLVSLRAVSHSCSGSTRLLRRTLSPIFRLIIGLLFAVPAAHAGYGLALTLAHVGIPEEWWRESFAVLGAIAVGAPLGRICRCRPTPFSDLALRSALVSHRLGVVADRDIAVLSLISIEPDDLFGRLQPRGHRHMR
jgi:hypothetical protein